jgi:hypothetical protein
MRRTALEGAFRAFRARVDSIVTRGAWSEFADEFTEDAVYCRLGHDDLIGREAIRSWITTAMTTFPGTMLVGFEVSWSSIDEEHLQVVYELRNLMRDPGDGSVHAASTVSLLTWDAAQQLWSGSTDLHNPNAYADMVRGWCAHALRSRELDPAAVAYLAGLD